MKVKHILLIIPVLLVSLIIAACSQEEAIENNTVQQSNKLKVADMMYLGKVHNAILTNI